jgi:phosphatidylserine/phosphatidylglycerophosphate/cardiolipin synthase-like enzyme
MSLLFSNEILDSVKKELHNATSSVQIITAYCKESSFSHLNDYINDSIKDKKLLVRFRMDDVLKGSTDFSIIEFGMNAGWKVYVRFDLHAKTYIVDNKRGLVGSANVTNSGLSIGKTGNMEMATLVDIEPKDIEKINKLFDDAILVNNELLTKMKEQIKKVSLEEKKENHSWDSSIITMFNPHIDTLFSYELPEDFSLLPGEYFSFLDETLENDIERFKETFRWSNGYMWLLNVLKENGGCMFFGELSQKLHNALISDPKPYRREVKQMLANLLELIEKLDMEEMTVDRPNYSQRVRLVDK